MLFHKNIRTKNILVQKKFGAKKFWCKKIVGQKNQERKTFLGQRNNLQKQFFANQIFLVKQNGLLLIINLTLVIASFFASTKKFGLKNCCFKTIFSTNHIWAQKNIRSRKFWVQNKDFSKGILISLQT